MPHHIKFCEVETESELLLYKLSCPFGNSPDVTFGKGFRTRNLIVSAFKLKHDADKCNVHQLRFIICAFIYTRHYSVQITDNQPSVVKLYSIKCAYPCLLQIVLAGCFNRLYHAVLTKHLFTKWTELKGSGLV